MNLKTILFKVAFAFSFLLITSSCHTQVSGEISVGILQSIGTNKPELISSSTQAVGVFTSTTRRFSKIGLRARFVVSKHITDRLSLSLQSGFNLRRDEDFWIKKYTYVSVPVQGGVGYKILNKNNAVFSVRAFSGINIFKIQNQLAKQYSGFIQDGELSYLFITKSFFKSIILTAGYEFQIDNETFFYKPINPSFKEEEFHYKIKRHQIYLTFGLGF
jgi:hypothetical protein